jgi:hypothetical protein
MILYHATCFQPRYMGGRLTRLCHMFGVIKRSKKKTIALAGCYFEVTINLYGALRRLRATAETRIVWIDALCINQEDLDERSQQVNLMGAIYEGCQQVLIWLGDSYEDRQTIEEGTLKTSTVQQAFALLHTLSDDKHTRELSCFTIKENSMLGVAEGYERAFDALQTITKMPYWRRIWVVQEIVLPPVATVVLGPVSAPWKIFVYAAMNFDKHNSSCCLEYNNSPGLYFDTLIAFNSAVMSIEDTRKNRQDMRKNRQDTRKNRQNTRKSRQATRKNRQATRTNRQATRTNRQATRTNRQAAHNLDIFNLLNLYFDREATVPLDKIYGLLGLVTWHGESRIVPNYEHPVAKVCEDVTVHIINSTKSLRVLVGDCVHNIDFPSWVSNWGQKPESGIWEWEEWRCDGIRLNRYFHYAATKNDATSELLGNSMLKVEGNRVDTIVAASSLISCKTWDESLRMCKQVLEWIEGSEKDYVKVFGSVGIWEDFYWKVLCGEIWQPIVAGGIGAYRRIRREDRGAYKLWKAAVLNDGQLDLTLRSTNNTRFQSFHNSIRAAISNRKFFVTREGHLGLGPNALQVGDEVYVINGSNVPFVLRKSDRFNLGRQPEDGSQMIPFLMFRLIGDCYVRGFMDGEACQDGGESAIPFVLC